MLWGALVAALIFMLLAVGFNWLRTKAKGHAEDADMSRAELFGEQGRLALIESNPKRFRFSPELKLNIAYKKRDWKDVMNEVKKLLQ